MTGNQLAGRLSVLEVKVHDLALSLKVNVSNVKTWCSYANNDLGDPLSAAISMALEELIE